MILCEHDYPISVHVISHHGHCWSVAYTGSVLNGRFHTRVRMAVPTAWYSTQQLNVT